MILCCGEALIDMVPAQAAGEAEARAAFMPLSGGAIFNTAIALGRLETPVQFFSGLSSDLFGVQLSEALNASGVQTDLVVRSNRPTTLAFVTLTDGHAQYTFYDENTAGRMLGLDDLPDLGADISALYFGGISLCAEPAASAYEALALRVANQALIVLDPNIRPGFIQDEQAYRARLDRMIGVAGIVKVSDEDLDWIVKDAQGEDAQVARLHALGAHLVVVTKGADGATAHAVGQPMVSVAAPKVEIKDTVGAGDTFNAGMMAQLHRDGLLSKDALPAITAQQLRTALAYGAKVAAITVSRSGANPPHLSEL
ncbi:carbohydrate kinase [uncultured Sulfitobacter sp.]|uniref:carbohydrate kinase family protein n=1 Tax=uncultured Sulfitobacter sp. TaxID=191468 RepID=UPI0026050E77|nr:carbohydrate kinase [uncultured Sulfitobacter sp.]